MSRTLGPYELGDKLGQGGMGEVYRATDPRLDRNVAVKVLPAALANDVDALHRFDREAKAIAALSHPNVLAVYDVGCDDGTAYVVTELLRGETLRARLREGAMRPREAVEVALQMARGLRAIHRAHVVHRDLKPSNVFLTEDGIVKILDFGIAARRSVSNEDDETRPTRPGDIVGTLGYMSPEQLNGDAIDERTDVFAFGAILFEMLTGNRAFPGADNIQLIAAVLGHEPPTIAESVDNAPGYLDELVARCLAKDPGRRPANVDEIVTTLEAGDTGALAPSPEQVIQFCTSEDGITLAYATSGAGPPLVKAANWLNHLEFDWGSPVWKHILRAFGERHQIVRYDARANGLSDRGVPEVSFEKFCADLETVVDAAGLNRFAMLGISQGCSVSIAYAVRFPERVSHLVLHGGYARGWRLRGSEEDIARREALSTLMAQGWGLDAPTFRDLFSSIYVPDATEEQQRWFSELERISASPEDAQRLWEAIGVIDVRPLLSQVQCPTLVLHCRGDEAVSFDEGRLMAASIPGARFVPLDSDNHLVLEQEAAWPRFRDEILDFLAT